MSTRRYFIVGIICGAIVISVFSWAMASTADRRAIDRCVELFPERKTQIDCLYELVEERMRTDGIAASFTLFQLAYERSHEFASSGCHRHAHKLGDMAYYQYYVPTRDLASLELGMETGACGYGFYHGLLEHLVQEHPDPAFVKEACQYLDRVLRDTLGDIRPICYHGSGHGFMLRHVEDLPSEAWGNVSRFVEVPLRQCGELTDVTKREREECEEGVYNVIVDWMETKQFGFTYNIDQPFAPCEIASTEAHRRACYYEMAMKLDIVARESLDDLVRKLSSIRESDLRHMAFGVAIAGLMQPVAGTEEYLPIAGKCAALSDEYVIRCLKSILHGLFEHGVPGGEYRKPLKVCASDAVSSKQWTGECYAYVSNYLPRFYDASRRAEICGEFPEGYRHICAA